MPIPSVNRAAELVEASRVTPWIAPGARGSWIIEHRSVPVFGDVSPDAPFFQAFGLGPGEAYTIFRRRTRPMAEIEVVMEDSRRELRRHLPILLPARGRVLVSGLGLGCVVKGLASKPEVDHIDVVEIDRNVIELVWPSLEPLVGHKATIHEGNALAVKRLFGTRTTWDFAWHDVWTEHGSLDAVHAQLLRRYMDRVGRQGCWQLPRWARRIFRSRYSELLEG